MRKGDRAVGGLRAAALDLLKEFVSAQFKNRHLALQRVEFAQGIEMCLIEDGAQRKAIAGEEARHALNVFGLILQATLSKARDLRIEGVAYGNDLPKEVLKRAASVEKKEARAEALRAPEFPLAVGHVLHPHGLDVILRRDGSHKSVEEVVVGIRVFSRKKGARR
jgi:hypothetical protein